MTGLGIFLLVIIVIVLLWPVISRWLQRKAMEKMEDYMRDSMGMPPREKKKSRKAEGREEYSQRQRTRKTQRHQDGPIIPKEYAEDVEFTETIEYSERVFTHTEEGEEYHESQISDAEYTEIKKNSAK